MYQAHINSKPNKSTIKTKNTTNDTVFVLKSDMTVYKVVNGVIVKTREEKQQEKNSSIPLKKKHSLLHQVIIGSSMYSNLEQVFRTDNGGSVTCLNGIRLFSMIWIIFGHTFNYMVDRSNFFLLCKIYSKCPLKYNYLDRHISPVQFILNVGY